ncbi:MAG: hypothetical protein AAGC86_04255 [Pseudomonadota bacterium]
MHYVVIFVIGLLTWIGLSLDVSEVSYQLVGESDQILPITVAFGIVLWFYSARFAEWAAGNTPPAGFPAGPTSHFTTRLRYVLFVLAYAGAGMLALLLIYAAPQYIFALLCQIPGNAFTECETAIGNVNPRSIEALALGLSVAIALLGLPAIDARWRASLQRAAQIPARATSLEQTLVSNFDLFSADRDEIERFLADYNGAPGGPRLFLGDLYAPRDDGYLESYPRCEFIFHRLDGLSDETRRTVGMAEFAETLNKLRAEMAGIRKDVAGLHEMLDKTLGRRFAGEIRQIHQGSEIAPAPDARAVQDNDGLPPESRAAQRQARRHAGASDFRGRRSDEYAITKLDDILKGLKATDEAFDESDEVLRGFMLKQLSDISTRSKAVYADVLKIIVLMSLRVGSPQNFLYHLGFDLTEGEADPMEVGSSLVVGVFVLSLLVTAVLSYIAPQDAMLILSHTLGMVGGAVFGAFVIANMIIGAEPLFRRKGAGVMRLRNCLTSFVGAVFFTALAVVLLGQFYPGTQALSLSFAPVSGLYGLYIAMAVFREKDFSDTRQAGQPFPPLPALPSLRDLVLGRADPPEGGVSHKRYDFALFAIAAAVLSFACVVWANMTLPRPGLWIVLCAAVVVPGVLTDVIWLLDRERNRRAAADGHRGTLSDILEDIRFLLVCALAGPPRFLVWVIRLPARIWFGIRAAEPAPAAPKG